MHKALAYGMTFSLSLLRRRRAEALAKGHELYRQGKKKEATEYFQKSVNVTPHMVQQVAKVNISTNC